MALDDPGSTGTVNDTRPEFHRCSGSRRDSNSTRQYLGFNQISGSQHRTDQVALASQNFPDFRLPLVLQGDYKYSNLRKNNSSSGDCRLSHGRPSIGPPRLDRACPRLGEPTLAPDQSIETGRSTSAARGCLHPGDWLRGTSRRHSHRRQPRGVDPGRSPTTSQVGRRQARCRQTRQHQALIRVWWRAISSRLPARCQEISPASGRATVNPALSLMP